MRTICKEKDNTDVSLYYPLSLIVLVFERNLKKSKVQNKKKQMFFFYSALTKYPLRGRDTGIQDFFYVFTV